MCKQDPRSSEIQERLTVTLGPGQREALEAIAAGNDAGLAFVVRRAIREFIENHCEGELPLSFPASRQKGDKSRAKKKWGSSS